MVDTTVDAFATMRSLMEKGEYKQALALVAMFGDQFPMMEPYYQEHHPGREAHCHGISYQALLTDDDTTHTFATKGDVVYFIEEAFSRFEENELDEWLVSSIIQPHMSDLVKDIDPEELEEDYVVDDDTYDEMLCRLYKLPMHDLMDIVHSLDGDIGTIVDLAPYSGRITVEGMKELLSK